MMRASIYKKTGHGRSGLEDRTMEDLSKRGVPYEYETVKIPWIEPEQKHKYTPDFILTNGIIVETKGIWSAADRKKMKLVKEQHPELDIRMIFCPRALKAPISKNAKSTNEDWCKKLGIPCAEAPAITKRAKTLGIDLSVIPQAWIDEPPCEVRIEALNRLRKPKK